MSVFEVDTKGTCLLCLNPNSTVVTINDCGDGELTQSAVAFNMLLRYLNVDIMKMSHFSSSVKSCPSDFNGVNLSVSLCGDCSSVSKDFLELFQTLEGIRLQMNVCFSQLLEFMEKGAKDLDRIGEYERRIQAQRSVKDLIGVSIAEGLRKETIKKVSQKLKFGVPRISLPRLNSKPGVDGVVAKDTKLGNQVPLLQSGEGIIHEPQHLNLIKRGHWDWDGVTMNESIPPENKKIKTSTSWSQMLEPKLEPLESTTAFPKIFEEEDVIMLGVKGSENKDKPSVQPPQVRENKEAGAEPKSNSVSCNKLPKIRCKCEICGKYFSTTNLLTHQLQRHTMTVLKDRLPSSISEETLESALNVIVAKSKIVSACSKDKPWVVRECYFCKRRQGYSLKVHLLKCHLEQIYPEHSQVKFTQHQTWNKPSTSSSSLKYSCNSCEKVFSTWLALKVHYTKSHQAPKKPWKCNDCEKSFTDGVNLRHHRVFAHPMAVFSARIPAELSDQDFHKGLDEILAKSRKVAYKNSFHGGLECPLCGKHVKQIFRMKLHLTHNHLDKIVENAETIRHAHAITDNYQFNPGTKLECIPAGEDDDNGYACEFESEMDPLAI